MTKAHGCKHTIGPFIRILICLLLSVVGTSVKADLLRVIAVDFTSSVGTNYTKRLPELIVDQLVNSGDFDVLERGKLTSLARELDFQAGAFVDPGKAVQVGSMSGAQLLITGNIIENTRSSKSATSYGIRSTVTRHYLKVRIEVIDLTTGSKLFSHVADDTAVIKSTGLNSVGRGESTLGPNVATKLVDATLNNKRIRLMVESAGGGAAEPVLITIKSDPEGADVEIDGVYLGNAGGEFEVNPGVHEILVSLPGYQTWSKKVKVRDGLAFTATLSEVVDQKIEIQVEQ
jgi:curli biogenesis system outer membrane secretion channel CsgG